jgi:endonuclease/exonuclease/phosphatase family metal-dependent hydrolase
MSTPETDRAVRVATLNLFGRREGWEARRAVLIDGFERLKPDLVSFQEAIVTPEYDQVSDVLGGGFHLAHHGEREDDGQGISIATRWPILGMQEVDLHVAPRATGFACSTLITEVDAPAPVGRLILVNHFPDWQLTHEYERELQTVTAARRIEELVDGLETHVIVSGDLDATPDAATIRFWMGRQSLGGMSVCYRDAWGSLHPEDPGHTFTPENRLVMTGETGEWELEGGRRIDYIFVRCSDHGPTLDIAACERIFDTTSEGTWASDHFGVVADLSAFTPSGRPVP